MSKYDIISENDENQVEMVELSDKAMEAVAGGGKVVFNLEDFSFDDLNINIYFLEVDIDIDGVGVGDRQIVKSNLP